MFGLFKKKSPPAEPAVRSTLFGDMPLAQWCGSGGASEPWSAFAAVLTFLEGNEPAKAIDTLRGILATNDLESRHYLQAWQVLRELGVQPDSEQERRVLGVVVEVAMGGGLDMVAAYEDLSARYYNFSGAAVIWEHPDDTLDGIIRAVLSAGGSIAQAIGPWEGDRPAAPPKDHVRLNILTPSGLMFGQAPMGLMASDPVGGQLVTHATELMQKLIAKTQAQGANV